MYKYPYGDSQQLNLDWVLSKLKELDDSGVGMDLEDIANAMISASFLATNTYNRSDIVFHNGKLYQANVNIPAPGESWNPAHWDEILIGDTLTNVVRYISSLNNTQVFNSSNVSGTHTSDALNNLKTDINDLYDEVNNLNGAINDVQGQICAFVETGNNATRAYGEGGYLVWKGVLYKVTSFITSGTAFNSGTGGNITAVTLGKELYKINRDSGWITLYDSNPQYIKYRRIGDVLYINGNLNSDGTRYVPVATLPTEYRPTVRQTTSIDFTNDPIVNAYINIGTDGSIALVNWDETAATNLFFHISFPL